MKNGWTERMKVWMFGSFIGILLAFTLETFVGCTMQPFYYIYPTSARMITEWQSGIVGTEIRVGRQTFGADLNIKLTTFKKYESSGYIPVVLYARPNTGKLYSIVRVYIKGQIIEDDTYVSECKVSPEVYTFIRNNSSGKS